MSTAVERVVQVLTEECGSADEFEARDAARDVLSEAFDAWAKATQTPVERKVS